MTDTAYQIQYRQEFVKGFEKRQSLLRDTVTTEAVIKGTSAVFLVADTGGAVAHTRGSNGLIPARADNLSQLTCTLAEWHDLVRKTGFNIFASQSDQKRIMQEGTMAVINRKTDKLITGALDAATLTMGAAATASMSLVTKAKAALLNNQVPNDGGITFLVTPAFMGYLEQTPEFTSALYVNNKPLVDGAADWKDSAGGKYIWRGCTFIEDPTLTGVGTAAETCYVYHKSAIGHALDMGTMQVPVDYNTEQDYSFSRASVYMGAKLLQNTGVIKITHDGSAMVAS